MSLSRVSAFCLFLSLFAGTASLAHSFNFVGKPPVANSPGYREWAWDGDSRLYVGLPATVHYQRGGPARIVITGPEKMLRRVQVGDGHIEIDHDWFWHMGDNEKLEVTVSGIALDHISLGGSGRMLLGNLDQDTLDLNVGGSGDVVAEGHIEHLAVNIGGSGKVAFDKVTSSDASMRIAGSGKVAIASTKQLKVTIAGSGKVDTGPADDVKVTIAGSGELRLASRPAHLHSTIMGSGRVVATDKDGSVVDLTEREHGMSRVDY